MAGRVPIILQAENSECALACLAMIASAHGHRIDLASLRARHPQSLKGATLVDVVRIAEGLQLNSRALRAEPEDLAQLALPCLLHWDLNHFVVLVAVERGHAVIHDPARGRRRLPLAEFGRHFTGVVLELQPAASFRPRDERRRVRLRDLFAQTPGLKRSLGQIALLALALEFFVLLTPFFMQFVVDDVLVSGDRDWLLTLGVGFLMLVLFQAGAAALRSWAVLALASQLHLQWLGGVFAHLMRLPVAWFEKRHAGDVLSRFASVQQIQRTLTTGFVEAVLDGLLVVLTLALMLVYSVPLTAMVLAATATYALLRRALWPRLRAASDEALVHEARQSSHFIESMRGVAAIKQHNAQAQRSAAFASHVVDTLNAEVAGQRIEIVQSVAQRVLFGLERVLVIWVGALLVLDQRLSVGMLIAFFAYREQFTLRIAALVDKVADFAMLRLQAERLADIALAEAESDRGPGALPSLDTPGVAVIELRDVHFSYAEGEDEVLRGVNLRIEAGESVAIVGPSGGGKTTLLKIMLGMVEPQSGQVLIGGVPLQRIGLAAWRAQVGAVMQDEPLFSGSVAANIAFFDPDAKPEWVHECAHTAAVDAEIEALPMAYETQVGDGGSALSGGQRQRVLLARALYRRPRVLMLDEATSALDLERERIVNQAVRQLALTRVIVAHRPETVASASRVVALHEGRITQDLRTVAAAMPLQ
jgi:ATP-binding cassette subfamily B protein RaxB